MGARGQERVVPGGSGCHSSGGEVGCRGTPVLHSWMGGGGHKGGWLAPGKAAVSRCCPEVPAPIEAGFGGEGKRS